jgi:two-component system chemotaxis response regulator CheY
MPKHVLIVDDSLVMRQMLTADLSSRGFIVDEASAGRGALEKARQHHYDLVVTDQNMPGMDGLNLVRGLRAMPGFERTPILVLTTETSEEMKAAFRQAGASGWMSKPFSPERMSAALAKLLPDSA